MPAPDQNKDAAVYRFDRECGRESESERCREATKHHKTESKGEGENDDSERGRRGRGDCLTARPRSFTTALGKLLEANAHMLVACALFEQALSQDTESRPLNLLNNAASIHNSSSDACVHSSFTTPVVAALRS